MESKIQGIYSCKKTKLCVLTANQHRTLGKIMDGQEQKQQQIGECVTKVTSADYSLQALCGKIYKKNKGGKMFMIYTN